HSVRQRVASTCALEASADAQQPPQAGAIVSIDPVLSTLRLPRESARSRGLGGGRSSNASRLPAKVRWGEAPLLPSGLTTGEVAPRARDHPGKQGAGKFQENQGPKAISRSHYSSEDLW